MNYTEWLNADITISYGDNVLGTVKPIDFSSLVFEDESIFGKAYDVLVFACDRILVTTDEDEKDSMRELIGKIKEFDANEKVECWYHPMGAWNVSSIEDE